MLYRAVKRLLDVFLSVFAMIVLSPVFIVAIIGIKLSSPGPAVFKAKRIGLHGNIFTMYKFRSMYLNSDKAHIITLRTDSRIFPFGKFIRKSKIDELPQLINILKGDMSIVGWRPEAEEYIDKIFVGKYKGILSVKPGLTSPGSLYDYTHGEAFDNEEEYNKFFLPKKLELELYYVNNQSFIYDVKLIIKTVVTIVLILFGKKEFAIPKEVTYIDGTSGVLGHGKNKNTIS